MKKGPLRINKITYSGRYKNLLMIVNSKTTKKTLTRPKRSFKRTSWM